MSKYNKFGHEKLIFSEDLWESTMGGCFPGERAVFRGKDVFSEFKNWGWLNMLFFCSTGKKLSANSEKFLNGLYCMCFNYADPRIWNNRVAALAGTVSSTAQLGVCASSAVSEAVIYGGPPVSQSLEFLIRAKKCYDNGQSCKQIIEDELQKNRTVFGYGRPISKLDERVEPAISLLKDLDLFDRPYMQLAMLMHEHLINSEQEISINIGGVMAGFCADEGATPQELYYLMVVCFYVGSLACYIDTIEKPEGMFFPIRCSRVKYSGAEIRAW